MHLALLAHGLGPGDEVITTPFTLVASTNAIHYPFKNMTTGEGGMLTTSNPRIAETAALLRQHGARQQYIHEDLGFNYRMTNMQAAIGLVQLDKLADFNERRIANAAFLSATIRSPRVVTPVTRPGARHVFHQYTLRILGEGSFPNAEQTAREVLSVPVYPGLSSDQLQCVAPAVCESVAELD